MGLQRIKEIELQTNIHTQNKRLTPLCKQCPLKGYISHGKVKQHCITLQRQLQQLTGKYPQNAKHYDKTSHSTQDQRWEHIYGAQETGRIYTKK